METRDLHRLKSQLRKKSAAVHRVSYALTMALKNNDQIRPLKHNKLLSDINYTLLVFSSRQISGVFFFKKHCLHHYDIGQICHSFHLKYLKCDESNLNALYLYFHHAFVSRKSFPSTTHPPTFFLAVFIFLTDLFD